MKTKLSIVGLIAALMYCCQEKIDVNSAEDEINGDSIQTASIEQQTLRKWFSFNREADSLISAAETAIEFETDHHEMIGKTKNNVLIASYHLREFKKKVKYIKEYAANTDHFDKGVHHTLDSLRVDYLNEKIKLEAALCEFKTYEVP